ncbi:hypothetical protein Efla_000036 [Eimeria flavescens]
MERHNDKYPTASVRHVCAKVPEELEKLKASLTTCNYPPMRFCILACNMTPPSSIGHGLTCFMCCRLQGVEGSLVTLDCLRQNLCGSLSVRLSPYEQSTVSQLHMAVARQIHYEHHSSLANKCTPEQEHEILTLSRAAAVPREVQTGEHAETASGNYINVDHVKICPRGFSRSELLLIARSIPRSELGGTASQPVVFRLQRPACTAMLAPTGVLSVMGGVTKEQALWQAFRVAYKLKYRVWWRSLHQRDSAAQGNQMKAEYVCKSEVEFSPEASSVLQLVCRVDLGGSFKPDVNAVLEHPQLRGVSIDTKDGVAVRIPQLQEAHMNASNSAETGDEDLTGDLFAFESDGLGGGRGRRPTRAKGPTCLIFRTGKVLVLGCRSPEEINAALDFVWPALVGL